MSPFISVRTNEQYYKTQGICGMPRTNIIERYFPSAAYCAHKLVLKRRSLHVDEILSVTIQMKVA